MIPEKSFQFFISIFFVDDCAVKTREKGKTFI